MPGSCQLMPSEMMLVIAGGWHCSGGKAGDSSTSHGEEGREGCPFCRVDGAGRRAGVLGGLRCSLVLWPGVPEGSPGQALRSIALEVGSVLPAISGQLSLVRITCTQDIQKSINLFSPGNSAED